MNNYHIHSSAYNLSLFFVCFTFVLLSPLNCIAQKSVIIGDFSKGNLDGWKEKVFKNKTSYRIVDSGSGKILEAKSRASGSGLFRELQVDLRETPCLAWSWKEQNILGGLNETTKDGDDYSARIYVVFSNGPFFWNARAINYVWSSGQQIGSSWLNAFTDRTINISVDSGPERVGLWVSHVRNIRKDYKRLFGKMTEVVDAVAIMTDTDNSRQSVTAYYGDIKFVSSCE